MVANAFGYIGRTSKRYRSIFSPIKTPPVVDTTDTVVVGDNRLLTKSWRVVESTGGDGAYLSVQYLDTGTSTWTQVHAFNTTT